MPNLIFTKSEWFAYFTSQSNLSQSLIERKSCGVLMLRKSSLLWFSEPAYFNSKLRFDRTKGPSIK